MTGEFQFSIIILLIYAIFFAICFLIAMIPTVINAIGLARICNKIYAFRPVWSWVWALLFPAVAVLRAGDTAAERADPYRRKMFTHGIVAVAAFTVLTALTVASMGAYAVFSETAENVWTIVAFVVMMAFALLSLLAAIWMAIPMCISYFRIFKLYMPTWGAWLTLAGMLVLSDLSFLILPVLSFLPMQEVDADKQADQYDEL